MSENKTPQAWDQKHAWGLWFSLLMRVSSIDAPTADELKWIHASIDEFAPTNVPARVAIHTYRDLPGGVSAEIARRYAISQPEIEFDVAVHLLPAWKRPADHWAYATKEDVDQPALSPACGCRRWNCKFCCIR
jgi:hypothetical protein